MHRAGMVLVTGSLTLLGNWNDQAEPAGGLSDRRGWRPSRGCEVAALPRPGIRLSKLRRR
jgi:hypothetical protein